MTRRTALQTIAAGAGGFRQIARGQSRRPNIILIMADDMGFSDIGCYGSEIATPNLDGLARDGARFTQFCNTARCCPTRSALLTGLYNHQTGVGHMIQDRGKPAYRGFLNDRCVTIGEALREGGYNTLMSGKWHVGEERPHWPTDRGFDRYFGLVTGADNYFRPQRQMALQDRPFKPHSPDFYMTDAFTDYAVDRIGEYGNQEKPYFLYLAYTAPHWPLHARPRDIDKYRGRYRKGWDALRRERHQRMIANGIVDRKWPLTPRDPDVPAWESVANKDARALQMAVYAAQIDSMDQGIGRVLAKVRETGQEDNTLIMFLADNGGCAEERIAGENSHPPGPAESFTSYGKAWANASNTPFRLYKHWVHEGGIASPFIARWPARIKDRGVLRQQPSHVIDIMATCLDAAGVQYPTTYRGRDITPLEGRSLLPAFAGKQPRIHDAIFWEHEGNRAVRQDNWKLVSKHPGGWELYDLAADRTEMNDLAAKDPDRVKRMASRYESWAARCGVLPWEQVRPMRKKA